SNLTSNTAEAHKLLQRAIAEGATSLDTHEVQPILHAYGLHTLHDGPGIKPEQRKHLFQPFVRGDSARSTSGTGLGLAIVQRIID
ncbi:ATP-binding protein, partial [Salmonella enterica subsp. enterica serovar Anatum]|nr:ATP-binding protein [Salmonella enterica subsp. enterica serovar Anatum]